MKVKLRDRIAVINTISSTNYRIYYTVRIAGLFVLGNMALVAAGRPMPDVLAGILAALIAGMGGWDYMQFKSKRQTDASHVAAQGRVAAAHQREPVTVTTKSGETTVTTKSGGEQNGEA